MNNETTTQELTEIQGQLPVSSTVSGAMGTAQLQTSVGGGAPATAQRQDGVTLLAVYHFMLAGLLLLATMGLAIPTFITAIVGIVEDSDALIATGILGLLAAVSMVSCLVMLAVGFGLWTLRQWARIATIALSVLGLMFVPIGTIIGGATLWYLLQPEVAEQFR